MTSTDQQREREIIEELIDTYKDLPCLWDISSEEYKDARKKKTAWELLLRKYKEIDANASEATVKKKTDNLKFGYQREAKKVKESRNRTGSAASDVYKPTLWYFDLMTFLEKKPGACRSGEDTLMSEEENDPPVEARARKSKLSRVRSLEQKKQKLIDTAQDLIQVKNKDVNSFGLYVGEKLDQIQGEQREIAEKLISDVIFFAKMNNLSVESKIYTPAKSYFTPHNFTHSRSSQQIQSPHSSFLPHKILSISKNHHPNLTHSPSIHSRRSIESPLSPHVSLCRQPSSTEPPLSPTFHSSQPIQSSPSSYGNRHSSSTAPSHSPTFHSSQPIQSSTSSYGNRQPSSTEPPHSPTFHSSQPIQSPPSSYGNRHSSSTAPSHSHTFHSFQPIQSPPSFYEHRKRRPSSTEPPHSPTFHSSQPIQSPPSSYGNRHSSSTAPSHSLTFHSSQPIQSPSSSYSNRHSSSTAPSHSHTFHSSQPIQSPPSFYEHRKRRPSSTEPPHSPTFHSSQPFQSPPSSLIPHKPLSTSKHHHPNLTHSPSIHSRRSIESPLSFYRQPSSTEPPLSPTFHSSQPIQSPPSSFEHRKRRLSSTESPHSPTFHSHPLIQSPSSYGKRHPSSAELPHSPTIHSSQPIQYPSSSHESHNPASTASTSPPHNPNSPTVHSDSQIATHRPMFLEGSAGDLLNELLIFKK